MSNSPSTKTASEAADERARRKLPVRSEQARREAPFFEDMTEVEKAESIGARDALVFEIAQLQKRTDHLIALLKWLPPPTDHQAEQALGDLLYIYSKR